MDQGKNINVKQIIKEYWLVFAFIGQLIMNYTITNETLKEHTVRIEKLEASQANNDIVVTEVRTKLASIETAILYIKDSLNRD